MTNGTQYTSSSTSYQNSSGNSASRLTDAVVDTMVRWPMRMTGATMDLMMRGMQSMTGSGNTSANTGNAGYSSSSFNSGGSSTGSNSSSGANTGWSSLFSSQTSGTFDQDLSGEDLKYVIWSIVFTKPGFECILQRQQEELVNYSADPQTYGAVKIAKFLDNARHGHCDRPEVWNERSYPADAAKPNRKESTTIITTPSSTTVAASSDESASARDRKDKSNDKSDRGWRIPAEDQKYIQFIYRVDRRLPKQEEVTRVERVTVERGTRVV